MIRFLIAALALVSLVSPSFSQSQPGDYVSAEARWIAHIKVGRVFQAELVKQVMAREGVSFDTGEFADMKTALGLDPVTDLNSITVYGRGEDPERAVAIVSGNVKLEQALDRLVFHMHREEATHAGLPLFRWSERDSDSSDDDLYTYVARRVDSDERLLLAAAHAEDVVHAAKVIRGEAPHLGSGGGALSFQPSPSALLHVTASPELLGSVDVDAPDEILKMLSSLRLEVGETSDNTYLDARIGVRDPTQAAQVVAIVAGAKAAVELLAASEPEAQQVLPLIRALHIENDAGNIHVRLDIANSMLLSLLEDHGHGDTPYESDETDVRSPRSESDTVGSTGWR